MVSSLLYLALPLISFSCSVPNCETCSESSLICTECENGFDLTSALLCVESNQLTPSQPSLTTSIRALGSSSSTRRRSSSSGDSSSTGIIIGCTIGGFFFLLIITCTFIRRYRLYRQRMTGTGIYNPSMQKNGVFVITSQANGGVPQPQGVPPNQDYYKNTPVMYPPPNAQNMYPPPNAISYPPPYGQVPYPPTNVDLNKTSIPSYNQISHQNIAIDQNSFNVLVPTVIIDEKGNFNDQNTCIICSNYFTNEEIRALPCKHAFHGKCLYEMMFVRNHKVCPICKNQYS